MTVQASSASFHKSIITPDRRQSLWKTLKPEFRGKLAQDARPRHAIALSSRALRPNAARAFLDYFYSDESLKVMAKFGEFVTRKGIHPPLPDAEKIQVVEMDEPNAIMMAEKRKEYRKIFQ